MDLSDIVMHAGQDCEMSIKLRCYCGQTFRAPDNRLGKRVRCPRCERIVRIADSRSPARKTPPLPPPIATVTAVQASVPPPPPLAMAPMDGLFPAYAAKLDQLPLSGSLAALLEEEQLTRERIEGPPAVQAMLAAKARRQRRQREWFDFPRATWLFAWLGAVAVATLVGATSREGFKLVALTAFAANLVCPMIVFIALTFQWARTMMFPDVDLLWYFLVPFYQPIKAWQHRSEMPISTRILCFAASIWITSGVFLGLTLTSASMQPIFKGFFGL